MHTQAAARRRLIALAALLLLLGGVALWFGTRGTDGSDGSGIQASRPEAGEGTPPALEGLARQAASPPAVAASSPEGTAASAPAPSKAASAAANPGARYEDTLPKVRVKLVLEGTGEPVVPRTVIHGGSEYLADQPVPVEPGKWIHVRTDDRRAAIAVVGKPVPTDVRDELHVLVPRADDPRLKRLTLRAVDAVTRAPLPRAYLDLGARGCDSLPRIQADAEGRIRVDGGLLDLCPAAGGTLPGLARAIYEPDHQPPAVGEFVPAIGEDTLVIWLERGEIEVPLEPLEAGLGRPARIRLVSPNGEPLAGLSVRAYYPNGFGAVMALRSDASGLVLWERAPSFFGLLVHAEGEPLAYVVLARRDEISELRMSQRARVELVFTGVPAGERPQPRWELVPEFRDDLDAVDPAQPSAYVLNGQPRARGRLITDANQPPWMRARPLGSEPRFEVRLPLGVRTRVFVGDRRYLDVQPQGEGERIEVAWEALPERP